MSGRILHASLLLAGSIALAACNRSAEQTQASDPAAQLAKLAPIATNDIAKTPELKDIAMVQGRALYETHCGACHGPDLKGLPAQHTPDLTDNEWMFVGDDIDTGGIVHTALDVENTVLNGIRARAKVTNLEPRENDAANLKNKNLAVMPPFGPALEYALTEDEIADVTEYTLEISAQEHDAAKATRGKAIFADKGSCYDCHTPEGTGDNAIGSTNLTQARLYLYGSSREAILETIHKGQAGLMPAFDGMLKPEEVKAISVYVFSQGGPGSL